MCFSPIVQGRLSLLLLLLLVGCASPAFAVDFNAYWQYRANGGEERDTQEELQQRYSLLFGPSLGYQPTHAIAASANVDYSRTEQDLGRGQGRETVETIAPGGTLSLTNDIFRARLSGLTSQNRRSAGTAFNSRSWDATLGSAWMRPLWPTLQLNYSEREDFTADDDAVDAFRDENKTTTVSVGWDLLLAQLYYDYTQNRNESPLERTQRDSDTHLVRFETSGTAWQERLNFNLSQQFVYTDSDSTRELQGEFGSALTNPDTLPNPEDFANLVLGSNPALRDGNRTDPALTVPNPNGDPDERRVHLGTSVDLREQIQEAYIYVDPRGALTGEQVADLQWDLYARELPDLPWAQAAAGVPAAFDVANNRVVLTINITARDIMVVATVPVNQILKVTEFEAVRPTGTISSTRTTNHLTSFSVRALLTRTLTAYSSLSVERIDSESDALETEIRRRSVSGNLAWRPVTYVAPTVSFSESRDSQTGAPELLTRSYSLNVLTNPLPTLNVTLGTTRTDRYEDDEKTGINTGYNLVASARIYPDLNASLFTSYNENENRENDGSSTTSHVWSTRLDLNARLLPSLTADLIANNRQSGGDAGPGTSSTDTTLSLRYRPSELLSLRLTGTRVWSGLDAPDVLTANLDLALVRTQKTQLDLRYTFRQADETSNRFGLNGSWNISRNLYFQTRADYTFAEFNSWRVEADLALRL